MAEFEKFSSVTSPPEEKGRNRWRNRIIKYGLLGAAALVGLRIVLAAL